MEKDIRWQQRFQNYQKALSQLQSAVTLANERPPITLGKTRINSGF